MTTAPLPTGPLVLDSSCWLEVFGKTALAEQFRAAVARPHALIVPVLTVYEVFKVVRRQRGDVHAEAAVAFMQQGEVVPIDMSLCLDAATNGLPMADSLIYATAQAHGATLWTQDAHFDGLPGVRYFPKS